MKYALFAIGFLSSCGDKSQEYFVDSVGHSIILIDKAEGLFKYSDLDGKSGNWKHFTYCSNIDYICIDGPFFISIPRSSIKFAKNNARDFIEVSSQNDGRICTVNYGITRPVGVRSFYCRRGNAPYKTYTFYEFHDSYRVESGFNIEKF